MGTLYVFIVEKDVYLASPGRKKMKKYRAGRNAVEALIDKVSKRYGLEVKWKDWKVVLKGSDADIERAYKVLRYNLTKYSKEEDMDVDVARDEILRKVRKRRKAEKTTSFVGRRQVLRRVD